MAEEYSIHLNIEQVESGEYLATSGDLPGLVAQGRTVTETMEIAQDVARKLIESYREHGDSLPANMKRIDKPYLIGSIEFDTYDAYVRKFDW